MSNHVLFELNRWRPILLYWCALWQVMMPAVGWMIWQQNKTSNALPLLLVRIPKILTNSIWAFVVLWNVYFRCSPSCVSWLPVVTCLPCALAVNFSCVFWWPLVTWLPCAYPLRCVKRFLGLVLTGSAEGFSLADKAINSATKSGR